MAAKNGAQVAKNESDVRPWQDMVQHMAKIAELEKGAGTGASSFDIAQNVVDKILTADTLDDLFDAAQSSLQSLKDADELHNVPVTVHEVAFRESSEAFRENGLGVYAVIDLITLHDGKEYRVSTGAPNVVSVLYQAMRKDWLPLKCRFLARATGSGQTLLTVGKP